MLTHMSVYVTMTMLTGHKGDKTMTTPRIDYNHANNVIALIRAELDRAVTKWPKHPVDPVHCASIVAEEAGELVKASLQYTYEGGGYTKLMEAKTEAIQTAVTAIRFVMQMPILEARPSMED